MNKRLIAFLPILSLFLSLPLLPVNAAVKAGGTCSKAGIKSVAASKTYTCVKSGKKLVWGKGVAVKARPTASASAAASAAPTMSASPMATKSAEPSKSAEPVAAGNTMERVKANNSASSCWTVISGNVYDLTRWIGSHPGGSGAIRSLCGTDGTAEFNSQHRGEGTPTARLAGYLLGPLAK